MRRTYCVCLALALFTGAAWAFDFIQMTDTHISDGTQYAPLFQSCVDYANWRYPSAELTFFCGDQTHNSGVRSEMELFAKLASHLSTPYYCAPGNHDVHYLCDPACVETYRDVFGPDYFAMTYRGYCFVFANAELWTRLWASPNSLATEHQTWFAQTLREAKKAGLPIIVIGHIPLFLDSPDEPDTQDNNLWCIHKALRLELLDLFKENGVILYLSGHIHRYLYHEYNGTQFVTAGAVSGQCGFLVWHIEEGKTPHHDIVPHPASFVAPFPKTPVGSRGSMDYIEPLQDLPNAADPTGWTAPEYDLKQDDGKGDPANGSSGWQKGAYGVGYGDNDDVTPVADDGSVYSVYTRATFDVQDVSQIKGMTLEVDYDDAFRAWINGVEIAFSRTLLGRSITWNSLSGGHEASGYANLGTPIDVSSRIPCLTNGTNVLALGAWNSLQSGTDLSLIPRLRLYENAPPASPILTRGPFLQLGSPTSATMVWDTGTPGDSVVAYGISAALGTYEHWPGSVTQHVVTLKGLKPATTYHYRVMSNGIYLSADETFRTFPDSTTAEMRFVALSDTQGTPSGAAAAAPAVAALVTGLDPDIILHAGDLVYSGAAAEYDPMFFTPFGIPLRRAFFYPAMGNHENYAGPPQPYYDGFYLPKNSPSERYYSFDYGAAHIVVLDDVLSDYGADSAQRAWLDSDLAKTNKRWKFAVLHAPIYTAYSGVSGSHSSDLVARESFEPLFERYGVSMVFCGHNHNYQRTQPIRDYDPDARGVVHIVTGGGGGPLVGVTMSDPFLAFVRTGTYHVMSIRIKGLYLVGKAVGMDGVPFDAFFISLNDNPDADGDGLSNEVELADLDDVTPGIQSPFDPLDPDTTGDNGFVGADGISDGLNDWDGDGTSNGDEWGRVLPPNAGYHAADWNRNGIMDSTEVSRVVGFYNAGSYCVDVATVDGYAPGEGSTIGTPHSSDYRPVDWKISATELSRLISLYNAGGYQANMATEDGFEPRKASGGAE